MPRASTIAIDGPVASGKTVVGQLLAKRLGYTFVDTGAIYRAVTLAVLRSKVDLRDEESVVRVAERTQIQIVPPSISDGRLYNVWVDGEDATWEIRSPDVEAYVSQVSRIPNVRRVLLDKQRALARAGCIVMVGRDIGTVVLPHADLKIFLIASPVVRARRRYEELHARGENVTLEAILENLVHRDKLDSERATAPLKPAADAVVIDTDLLSVDDVVSYVARLVADD